MTPSKHSSAQRRLPGFTLLELMIATVLGSILLLTASALFMTFMIGNANTNARRQLSAEGLQMLGTLEYHIRSAKSATCGGGQILSLTKLDGTFAQACFASSKLNFNSTGTPCGDRPLNSDFPTVTGSTVFTCPIATNGKQFVTIQFILGTTEGGGITETFSRIIQLRNS